MRRFAALIAGVALLLPLGFGGGLVFALMPASAAGAARPLAVPAGTGAGALGARLQRAGLVKSGTAFALYARLSGLDRRLRPGTFVLSPAWSAPELLGHLVTDTPLQTRLVVPEGFARADIARRLDGLRPGLGEAFLARTADAGADRSRFSFLGAVPAGQGLEGYLFPDTYDLPDGEAPEAADRLASAMLARFGAVVAAKGGTPGLSWHQRATLASIVEKEAVLASERPRIAGVFFSRLARGIPLGSDPTVEFALGRHQDERGLSLKDVAVASPYNTYRHAGLPPGPIANAGARSFEAIQAPERGDWLYFVAKGDGSHVFTRTYAEHLRAQASLRR